MKAVVGRTVLSLLLFAAGGVLWTLGRAEQRLADAHKDLATLQFAAATTASEEVERALGAAGRLPWLGAAMLADARDARADAQYWLSAYPSLALQRDATGALTEHDARRLFLAANAAYRSSQLEAASPDAAVRRLDIVLRAYADVLKAHPGDADAAYNYEFVARKRGLLLHRRPATAPKPDAASTIHGRPGSPPSDKDMREFKMVIPKRDDEREDPNAGRGGVKVRKG